MEIVKQTLLDCWQQLNWKFIDLPSTDGMYMPSRDYTRVFSPVRLVAKKGFGFSEEDRELVWPEFYASLDKRISLLWNRYIDPPLWEEGIARLKAREKRMSLKNPLSFVIQFHRRATSERKVPAGGGCLTQVTFIWVNGSWRLHVFLRASEITAALSGDIVFLEHVVSRVCEEVRLKNWDDEPYIIWDIALASQMKAIVPLFMRYMTSDLQLLDQVFVDPRTKETDWKRDIVQYFWEVFIHPERITWNQRKKWSTKFFEITDIDWTRAEARWRKEFADL